MSRNKQRIIKCKFCDNSFTTLANRNLFCSLKCRLFNSIQIGKEDECWLWKEGTDKDGYGKLRFQYKQHRTHRTMFEIINGYIHNNLMVMHSCDNPPCCNPNHLSLGTAYSNAQDRNEKGRARGANGIKNGNAKLTTQEVNAIKSSHDSAYILAKRFDVKPNTIWRIKNGERRANG